MPISVRTLGVMFLALMNTAATTAMGRCCPFCPSSGLTLSQTADQATLILFGIPSNPKFDPNMALQGSTELQIESVIKSHPFIEGKKTITINRYIPVNKDKPQKYLVFCDVYKDKLDPYQGIPQDFNSKIAEYLKGALDVRSKDVTTRLAYFFKYLDSSDINISDDAFQEFANSDYKDYRPLAEKLPPDRIVAWLKDENTPQARFGLYGSMLGHCGKSDHAQALRNLLDDPNKRFRTGIDGVLAGYVMLQPKDGMEYVRAILNDDKREFLDRYAALRTLRFFWEYRQDLVNAQQLVDSVSVMLPQDDIADLVIEDLRKWHRWEMTDKVLGYFDQKSHEVPIIRRSIMRFALQAAASKPKAAAFVEQQKKRDADWVKDVDELLQLELSAKPPAPSPAPATTRTK